MASFDKGEKPSAAPAPSRQLPYPYRSYDAQYGSLIDQIAQARLKTCRQVDPATGSRVEAYSIFAAQIGVPAMSMRIAGDGAVHLTDFPDLEMKKVNLTMVAMELAWFLRGGTNGIDLETQGCKIWGEWRKAAERGLPDLPPGELGPIYGFQWRKNPGGDQIRRVIDRIATDPFARDHVVSAWDAQRLKEMVLKPCHFAFQFVCEELPCDVDSLADPGDGGGGPPIAVNCAVTMRSTDVGLGLPFNIASYSLLTALVAAELCRRTGGDFRPGEVVFTMNDCHIYKPHLPVLRTVKNQYLRDGEKICAMRTAGPTVAGPTVVIPAAFASPDGFAAATKTDIERMFPVVSSHARAPFVRLPLFT